MDQARRGRLSLKRPYEPQLKQRLIGIDDHSRRLRIGRESCNSLVCRSKSLFEPCQFWLTNQGSSNHPFETNCPTDERKPSSRGHVRCGSGGFMSAGIGTFCVFRYSMMLRRKTCDRVKSFLAQKASTVAIVVLGYHGSRCRIMIVAIDVAPAPAMSRFIRIWAKLLAETSIRPEALPKPKE
jgi:hypothetical protein